MVPSILLRVLLLVFSTQILAINAWSPLQIIPFVDIVPSRHVAIYFWNGALQPGVFDAGLHWRWFGLGATPAHIFTGIDRDKVPPQSPALNRGGEKTYLKCRSRDGSTFQFIIEVSNKLAREHVHETVRLHGINYDTETIYNQAEFAMAEVCSNMTSEAIAMTEFHLLDDRVRQQLQGKQIEVLDSKVEIVQVKILEMVVPPALDTSFAKQASEKARMAALREERLADAELILNQQAKSDAALEITRRAQRADMELAEHRVASQNKIMLLEAEAKSNASLIDAEAKAKALKLEADANKAWLTEQQLRKIESENLSLFNVLKGLKASILGPAPNETCHR